MMKPGQMKKMILNFLVLLLFLALGKLYVFLKIA